MQSGSWASVDAVCSPNLRFSSAIKSRGTWRHVRPKISVERGVRTEKASNWERGRVQGGESKEERGKSDEGTTMQRRKAFIHVRQCCPDTQLGVRDPNRRQKEKRNVLKQRRHKLN